MVSFSGNPCCGYTNKQQILISHSVKINSYGLYVLRYYNNGHDLKKKKKSKRNQLWCEKFEYYAANEYKLLSEWGKHSPSTQLIPLSWGRDRESVNRSTWLSKKSVLALNSREKIEILSSCSQNEHCQFCWLLPAYTSASGALCRWRRCQKKDAQRNFCAGVPNKSIHTFSIFSKVIPSSSFQVTPWPLKARPRCHHLALH